MSNVDLNNVLENKTCNHFSECKQMIKLNKIMSVRYHLTIAILVCKQITSNSFKNEITDKLSS